MTTKAFPCFKGIHYGDRGIVVLWAGLRGYSRVSHMCVRSSVQIQDTSAHGCTSTYTYVFKQGLNDVQL